MWINQDEQLYFGDCVQGDREATPEEVAAWEASLSLAAKNAMTASKWQIRKALNATGLRAGVEAAVAAADQDTRDGWDFADEFRRDHPLIAGVALALGKTEAEIDALFALAVSM